MLKKLGDEGSGWDVTSQYRNKNTFLIGGQLFFVFLATSHSRFGFFGSFSVLSEPWGMRVVTQRYSELVCINQFTYPWIRLPEHLPQLLLLYTQVCVGDTEFLLNACKFMATFWKV